jgi:phosphate/sulfate permease
MVLVVSEVTGGLLAPVVLLRVLLPSVVPGVVPGGLVAPLGLGVTVVGGVAGVAIVLEGVAVPPPEVVPIVVPVVVVPVVPVVPPIWAKAAPVKLTRPERTTLRRILLLFMTLGSFSFVESLGAAPELPSAPSSKCK